MFAFLAGRNSACGFPQRELAEPRASRSQRAHEGAGAQQCASRASARAQKAIEPLLIDFLHMQQPVCGWLSEGRVFDVFAQDSRALFFAAAEQIAAIVIVGQQSFLAPIPLGLSVCSLLLSMIFIHWPDLLH